MALAGGPEMSAAEEEGKGARQRRLPAVLGRPRKESRGKGAKASGPARPERDGQWGKKKAKRAKSEEGREKRKKFHFFFQINFPNSFSS